MPTSSIAIQVHIVDDHGIFRDGLSQLLRKLKGEGIQYTGESSNGLQLLQQLEHYHPHIILMDIQMPQMDGIKATAIIKKLYPFIYVIGLSSFDELWLVTELIAAGAKGFLLKSVNKEELITAIKNVFTGGEYYTPRIAARLESISKTEEIKQRELSQREMEVVRLFCQGRTNKEIACTLSISPRTVEGHRKKIMIKVNGRHPADVFSYALRHGIHKL
jgi:two-component system, NarL family, response regulator DegU